MPILAANTVREFFVVNLYNSTAENCCTTGTVVRSNGGQTGGIAGESVGSTLNRCFTSMDTVTVNANVINNCATSDKLFSFDGGGTENNPYLIQSAGDLRLMSDLVNVTDTYEIYGRSYYK